jgi:hypothetical protein
MLKLLLCFLSLSLHAAVIDAPIIQGADFQQNPSHIEWKKIDTEHFEIIFSEEIEAEAQRVAHLVEKAYPFVARSLETFPKKIPLILQNQSLDSNGFVTLAPRRSEWFVAPSIDPELGNTEWLKTLAIHEFRHVVQFQKTRRGFNRGLEIILGEIGQALGLGLTLPPWFLEGDAVGTETALTRGGRGRLPLFDRDLRTLLLSGKKWNYDKAHLGSYEDYVPNHYVYGYFYTSWLRNKYGDLFLSRLANRSADNSWNPLNFYRTVDELTPGTFEDFYDSVMRELIQEWKTRLEKFPPTGHRVTNLGPRYGWTNYLYPQASLEGKVLALKRGLSFYDRFVLLDGEKEEVLFYPGPFVAYYPFKLRNDRLAIVERELDPRWGYRDFGRVKVYDLKKRSFIMDVRKTRARIAVLDPTGTKLALVFWDSRSGQWISLRDLKNNEHMKITWPRDQVITSIDWKSGTELVMVVRDFNDEKSIRSYDLETKSEKTLLAPSMTNIGTLSVESGEIFFESPESGIDNIYHLSASGPRQITRARFGAYAPEIEKGKLLYNDYTVSGMNVVTKTLPWDEEENSEGSFYPIFEKFASDEKFSDLATELQKKETYPVQKYSQARKAFNLHSWIILAPPLSSTVTLIGISRDVLNKFSLSAGGLYNLNEGTPEAFVTAAWTHLYPVFDLRAAYGNRKQTTTINGTRYFDRWEEGTFEAGASLPWNSIQGRFLHSFTTRAFAKIIKVTNKLSDDLSEIRNGALYSPGAEFQYSVLSRMSRRDLNPEWGFQAAARVEEGKDITDDDQKGSLRSVDGRAYLPGLWHHHSFFHQLAYERQRDDFYQYSSLILYPRGTRNVFLQEFRKYSGNYFFPLFYPDYNLSRYLYLKRISLNLFYDELNGRYESASYQAASTGWETIFEVNILRIFIPLNVGLRGSYVLQGEEKKNNYEVFLTSLLGTF